MVEELLLGAAIAFAIATLTTPVGVSGAVFLVPVQISVLQTPSPAVTPTNLLYNLVAIPGALLRFRRTETLDSRLTKLLAFGSLPGVIAGAVIRVELLSGPEAFLVLVAAVLIPLGARLLVSPRRQREVANLPRPTSLAALAFGVGVVGGIYGIGGGSILAPALLGMGFAAAAVAPAALAATFITSIAGVLTFAALSLQVSDSVAPDWGLGIALGLGGLGGSYLGAALQPGLPETLLRRVAGVMALVIGVRYAVLGLT